MEDKHTDNSVCQEYIPEDIYKKQDCPICLDKDSDFELECKHRFHKDCIKEWLKIKHSCPLCRSTVKHEIIIELLPNNEPAYRNDRENNYNYIIGTGILPSILLNGYGMRY